MCFKDSFIPGDVGWKDLLSIEGEYVSNSSSNTVKFNFVGKSSHDDVSDRRLNDCR